MENASKALLIAGAILLVIAIIAIGMVILGQGQDVVDKTGGQINTLAINAHNSQFGNNVYTGAKITGKEFKRIATVAASNNSMPTGEKVVDVTVKVAGNAADIGAINVKADYNVTSVTYDDSGAITEINCTIVQ